jgi:ASC-1-like (ASCH) protein
LTAWQRDLIAETRIAVLKDKFWSRRFNSRKTIHLAVFSEPYLQYVLDGQKTIESRFSVNRCAPYNQVRKGDIILLKQTGGPIVGLCEATEVWSYVLKPKSLKEIRKSFGAAICVEDPKFWEDRKRSAFATLIGIEGVTTIEPLSCEKRDRRGWVVLGDSVGAINR